jgi:hypothetical protein
MDTQINNCNLLLVHTHPYMLIYIFIHYMYFEGPQHLLQIVVRV